MKAGMLYVAIFAVSIAVATFIENDFGTSAAQKLVFRARWFEVLMFVFAASILRNIYLHRLIPQKKWASLTFHMAIICILAGAAVTRFFGFEGMMHIREGDSSSEFLSAETHLNFAIQQNEKLYRISEPVLFASLGRNSFEQSYQIGDQLLHTRLVGFIPNPKNKLEDSPEGKPVIKVVVAGNSGREEFFIPFGDKGVYAGTRINFGNEAMPGYQNISLENDSLFITTAEDANYMVMATQEKDSVKAGIKKPLRLRALYSIGNANLVVPEYNSKATVKTYSENKKIKNESTSGVMLEISDGSNIKVLELYGRKGEEGTPQVFENEKVKVAVSYGSSVMKLPFQLHLRDFQMDRYPGTDNPSSYASEITLEDNEKQVLRDQRIYMNHILDYRGYRFFQSSYDPDEKGTYLSVNHDFWGTWISYLGYFLLTLGLMMIFFSKKTRFSYLIQKLDQVQNRVVSVVLIFLVPGFIYSQSIPDPAISKDHADVISRMIIQDFKGRMKPFQTSASEVLRKISKKSELYNMSESQLVFSMMMQPEEWEKVPLIDAGSHPDILKLLNAEKGLVAYQKFFDDKGEYILKEQVRNAQHMNPKDQGTFEKAIVKLDEKLNIANMIFTARILKVFPVEGDQNNTWVSPSDIPGKSPSDDQFGFARAFITNYFPAIQQALDTKDYSVANDWLRQLHEEQLRVSGRVVPSDSKVKAELLFNQLSVFSKLRNVYSLLGIIVLFVFLYNAITHKLNAKKLASIVLYIMIGAFVFHTIGLALRWFISGHAPWTNGYESMIYIAWTTVLAGLIFSRKSLGGLAATCVLAATILLVAGMSWLDPEITPLVPVLNSYWLTIHVSMEAGSYGFLLLGAVIGMMNLILMIAARPSNIERIKPAIVELTIISEITVTGGLIMVSIGTYLGGVWANESWGRYWGWDAKETWALVTTLVYAFILHMRFIPGLKSIFAYNLATLFGFATVIMTYYGVNYYLSGLHSYAAGDPVPIPPQVYYTTLFLVVLSVFAFFNYRKQFDKNFIV